MIKLKCCVADGKFPTSILVYQRGKTIMGESRGESRYKIIHDDQQVRTYHQIQVNSVGPQTVAP